MGVIFDYFHAPSDELAAATVDWIGGPSRPNDAALPQPKSRWFKRQPKRDVVAEVPGYPTVDGVGIDPAVQLGQLVALLQGISYEEATSGEPGLLEIATGQSEECWVVRLDPNVAEALAGASQERLAEVAIPWSETEEFWGNADPAALTAFLEELANLSREANDRGHSLYCWFSL